MGEFYGSMQDIGLPEILSFLKGLSKTGSLRISQGRWTAEAWLRNGRVIAAAFNDEHGIPALEAMAERGYDFRREPLWPCPYLDLPSDWDRYLGSLTANRRQTLRTTCFSANRQSRCGCRPSSRRRCGRRLPA